jgi:hypothetical protein
MSAKKWASTLGLYEDSGPGKCRWGHIVLRHEQPASLPALATREAAEEHLFLPQL